MSVFAPVGTPTHCGSCGDSIVWLMTGNPGKRMPVNAETVSQGDLIYERGRHVSHFATCRFADRHRKPR